MALFLLMFLLDTKPGEPGQSTYGSHLFFLFVRQRNTYRGVELLGIYYSTYKTAMDLLYNDCRLKTYDCSPEAVPGILDILSAWRNIREGMGTCVKNGPANTFGRV